MQLETIVTIAPDGRTANARGIDFALVGSASPGDSIAEWREAVFENTYVKEGSAWKIATMHLYPRFATDYALGWAKDARPAPVPSEEFPPDAPPTVMHGVYPDFSIPPFHFRNPVTGALPRYPDGVVAAAPPASLPVAAPAGPAGDGVISVDGISEAIAMAERRVDRALAHDAVENVANAYNFYLDEFAGESARELFAENGSAAVINAGVAGGRESIREAIEAPRRAGAARRPSGFIMIHQTLQPVILVDDAGDHARFRLRLFGSSGRVGEEGAWIAGVYDGEASPQRGGWQLERMDLNLTWAADYSAGWASAAPFAQIASVPLDLD